MTQVEKTTEPEDCEHTDEVKNIVAWCKLSNRSKPWDSMLLDVCVVSQGKEFLFNTRYRHPNSQLFDQVTQPISITHQLNTFFVALRRISQRSRWNKLRMSIDKDSNEVKIMAKWDEDYAWLRRVSHNSPDYNSLEPLAELCMYTWEGLSPNHPRTWVKTKVKPRSHRTPANIRPPTRKSAITHTSFH